MAFEWATGFEHQTLSTAGGGLFDGTNLAAINTVNQRSGNACLRLTGTSTDIPYVFKSVSGTISRVVAVCYVRFGSLPTATTRIFGAWESAAGFYGVSFNSTSSQFAADITGTLQTAGGPTLTTGTWYRVEFDLDTSATTYTLSARVATGDDSATALTGGTKTGRTANPTSFRLELGQTFNPNSAAIDSYYDDVALYLNSSSDYPIGPVKILGYAPTADGTHNVGSGSHYFTDNGSGTEAQITNSTTTAFGNVDDSPLSADSAHVVIK